MTGRDRTVLIVISVLAVLAAGWILVVSPERGQASKLESQVSSAQSELSSAEGKLAHARTAQSQYAAAYTSVVNLGKAVPPGQEVPSLIYELSLASNQKNVEFNSITSGSGAAASTAKTSAIVTPAAAGFTQMPFTFVFDGSFFKLEQLFHRLDGFASTTSSGTIRVSGRLLTIQSIKLSPANTSTSGEASGTQMLSGTITASAYQLPAGQGVTGSATTASGATPVAGSTSASSATAPAVVKVTP